MTTAAASTSVARGAVRPQGLSQLNDSVWQLYSPADGTPHNVDIIFFHGLQMDEYEEAFWKSWCATTDAQLVWPKDWLSQKLPDARMLSVTYDSSVKGDEDQPAQGDLKIVGGNLVLDIVLNAEYNIGQNCPVFLVGHCLGGIVIKQFILDVIQEKQFLKPKDDKGEHDQEKIDRVAKFLENFKGAFFYGTPNGGVRDKVTAFAGRLTNPSPILKFLKALDTERGRINEAFRQHRSNMKVPAYGIAEGRKTHSKGFHDLVVPEASTRHDVDHYYTHVHADHFTVCQARSAEDPTVIKHLTSFISDGVPAVKAYTEERSEARLLL